MPYKPWLYAFTFDDWVEKRFPLAEWVEWHGSNGYPMALVYVLAKWRGHHNGFIASNDHFDKVKPLLEKYGVVYAVVKASEWVDRDSDPRAYYKQLAQWLTPPGLKVLLDIDEFIPFRFIGDEYVPSRGMCNILEMYVPTPDLEGVWELDKDRLEQWRRETTARLRALGMDVDLSMHVPAPAPVRFMCRVHWDYAQVITDGGTLSLQPDQYKLPLPVIHLTLKRSAELIDKTWLWAYGVQNITWQDIERLLPVRKKPYPIPEDLKRLLKPFFEDFK